MIKKCTKCGEEKPLTSEYFHKDKTKKNGFRSHCKECICKPKKIKYISLDNGTTLKECTKCNELKPMASDYFHNDISSNDGLTLQCKECRNTHYKTYYDNNKDKMSVKNKTWRENNVLYKSQLQRKWYMKNSEKIKSQRRDYYKSEQGKIVSFKTYTKRKIYMTISALEHGFITKNEWDNAKKYFNNSCAYCGNKHSKLEKEHFIPVSKYGLSNVTNILPVCKSCNCSKHDKDFEQWYKHYEHYSRERELKIYDYLYMVNDGGLESAIL